MVALFTPPVLQAIDMNGEPYSGAKLYFYQTGTTTLITVYQNSTLTTPHANPVVADASGQFAPIYVSQTSFKIVLTTSADVTIRTVDPVIIDRSTPIFDTVLAASGYKPDIAPDALQTVGHTVVGVGGALYKKVATQPTHAGKFSVTLSDGVTVVWYEISEEVIWTSMLGADPTSVADQTARVQDALNVWIAQKPEFGGGVLNDRGVKFDPSTLTFSKRGYLTYISDDDLHQNPQSGRGAGELVRLVFGASDAGIANEHVFEAPYGVGLITNLNKSLPGQDAYLGTGQARIPTASISAKIFWLMQSERVATFGAISEEYGGGTRSVYDGIKFHAYKREMTVTVSDTTGFSAAVGAKVEGLTSKAFGYYISKTATTVLIDWQYGQFVAGEEFYSSATPTVRPLVSSTSMTKVKPGQHQWFSRRGNITWGVPPGNGITDYSMGGRLLLTKSIDYGQERLETVTDPALVFCRDVQGAAATGKQIALNSTEELVLRDTTAVGGATVGYMGRLVAMLSVSDDGTTAVVTGKSLGATVARGTNTGEYDVTFSTAQLSSDYHVMVTSNTAAVRPVVTDWQTGKAIYTLYGYNNLTAAWAAHRATVYVFGRG